MQQISSILRVTVLAALMATLISGGCKKGDDSPSQGGPPATTSSALIQRVTWVSNSDTSVYVLWYGGDTTVDSCQLFSQGIYRSTTVFTHQPNFIRAEWLVASGGWAGNTRWDTSNLDASGRAVRLHQEIGPILPLLPTYWYDYSPAGELIYTRQNNTHTDTVRHVWANGDLVLSYGERGDTTFYGYDLSRPSLPGDAWQRQELFVRGRNRATSAHLRTSIREAGVLTSYQYSYDSVGRIVRMQLLGGASPREYFYEY